LAKLSFASGILFESILRPNDPQKGFHTAKTRNCPANDRDKQHADQNASRSHHISQQVAPFGDECRASDLSEVGAAFCARASRSACMAIAGC
jgi:hypothetical protein